LRREDVATCVLAAGAFGGAVVVLVASLGDFQTQFPVVAIPFAALATVGVATRETDHETPRRSRALTWAPWPLVLVVLALVPLAARIWDVPTTGEALVARGRSVLTQKEPGTLGKDAAAAAAERFRDAVDDDPLLDEAHVQLGVAILVSGGNRDEALQAFGRARLVSRGHAGTNLLVGETYLRLLGTAPAPYGPPGDSALAALREAGALEPRAFVAAFELGKRHGLSPEEMRALTPDRGHAKIRLADHLTALGRADEAREVLVEQLRLEPWDAEVAARLARAFVDSGREVEGRTLFSSLGVVWPK
jgi:tetratricopeptide (TPR) repeat protein